MVKTMMIVIELFSVLIEVYRKKEMQMLLICLGTDDVLRLGWQPLLNFPERRVRYSH